ncbi:MAG: hypothetical protein P8L37_09130 [Phycisphaerales bacterium]|nr:hypothetical protein [Phycisphaerales bacterium]
MGTTIGTLQEWQSILSEPYSPLLDAAADARPGDLQAISKLRKHWPAAQVAIAVEIQDARRRSHGKFPHHPQLIADVAGVQQATPWSIATAKAQRFDADMHVLDGCCGIGGDAMALASRGAVTAIDCNPVRCWMAQTNAGCAGQAVALEDARVDFDAFHIDPSRRDPGSGRRLQDPEQWLPALSSLEPIRHATPNGVIKLGPGIDLQSLPMQCTDEVEFCSLHGALSQAHLWCGKLATAPGLVRATRYPDGESIAGEPAPPPAGSDSRFGQWLAEADPALERARLHGAHGDQWSMSEPCPGLGLLTGHECPDTPWFTMFEVLEQMPWRPSRVQQAIRSCNAGIVEVKTRDNVVDPDPLQRRFSGTGDRAITLFVLRCQRSEIALITQRVHPPAQSAG